jgi:hypothetical protein
VEYVARLVPEFGAVTCDEALTGLAAGIGGDEAAALREAEIEDVYVDDDSATIRLKDATTNAILRKVDGRWYIAGGVFEQLSPGSRRPGPTARRRGRRPVSL